MSLNKEKTSEHECMSREVTHFEKKEEEAKINRASETCSAYRHTSETCFSIQTHTQ